ncbi:hypothetical protein ACMD2_17617 [Ananas comosus]|uniref:DDE Tnp4 domain-containing protein n=1 Tax=Ananas comosus TaxID=4615 RepID=A0A199UNW5_ANACO|nr:hypothetical protein ACMD2_17617 [Ananas comosus]
MYCEVWWNLDMSTSNNRHPMSNAVVAVNGTDIPTKQPKYHCRKGFTSHNMMAACSLNHQFLFVCIGWERYTADMRVLRWCCESGGFTLEGYANTDCFLAPYQEEQHYLSQFDTAFGIPKRRFKVLRKTTPFPYNVQCRIAYCVIHNFIKRHQGTDRYFNMQMDQFPTDDQNVDSTPSIGLDESRRGDALCTMI